MHHICLPKSNLRIGDHPTGIRKTKPGKAGIGPFPRRGKKNPIALTPFPTICHRYIRCIFCRPGLRLYFAVCINKVKARAHPKVYPNTARPVGGCSNVNRSKYDGYRKTGITLVSSGAGAASRHFCSGRLSARTKHGASPSLQKQPC